MSTDTLNKHLADYFKALGHPTRLKIIELLREGEKCVCEIVPVLELEQPNVSSHLAILRKEGILSAEKRGMNVIYTCKNKDLYRLIDLSKTILGDYWDEKRISI